MSRELLGWVSFFFPFIGIFLGLRRAFNPDAEERQTAGNCLAWAWLGICAPLIVVMLLNASLALAWLGRVASAFAGQ